MPTKDNVIRIDDFRRNSDQETIDDIGAQAFLFLRDAAEEMGVPIKDVIVEHMMGLALVMSAVEGETEAKLVLQNISDQLVID